jgi:glycosyltransferase involved in cell wall biosynthesis
MHNSQVLFIGLGKTIPPFIEQRIAILTQQNLMVTVLYDGKIANANHGNIIYLSKQPLKLILNFSGWFFRFMYLLPWLWIWKRRHGFGLVQWTRDLNGIIALLQAKNIKVIHAQWFLKISMLEFLKKAFPKTSLIISARGSQVSVYPLTLKGWVKVLENNFESASLIHCVSNDIMKHCLELGCKEEKLWINYNGIRTDLFKSDDAVKEKGVTDIRLISVGALIWRKGYIYQLLLLRSLLRNGINASLTIVGAGPDLNGIMYTAKSMGISERIDLKGKVSLNEVVNALNEADIYISTSIAEGLPNSVAEAAACGLPIVAFECEGLKELLLQEIHPYIVPFGDLDALVTACKQLVKYADREQMSIRLRQHIHDNFNAYHQASLMIERYKSMVNE